MYPNFRRAMTLRTAAQIILDALRDAARITQDGLRAYFAFLLSALALLGATVIGCVALLFLAPTIGLSRIVTTFILGVAAFALLAIVIVAFPVLAAADTVRKMSEGLWLGPLRVLALIAETGLVVALGIWFLPTDKEPRLIPLLVVAGFLVAIWGTRATGDRLRSIAIGKVAFAIVALSLSAYFPVTTEVLLGIARDLDKGVSVVLTQSTPLRLGPSDAAPLLREDDSPFALVRDGSGRVWYQRRDDGRYVFFTGFRVLPDGARLQLADTDEELAAIRQYLAERRIAIADSTERAQSREIDWPVVDLRSGPSSFAPKISELSRGGRVTVVDSQFIGPRAGEAILARATVLEARVSHHNVLKGAHVLIVGESVDSFIVALGPREDDPVGTVVKEVLRPAKSEYWYRVTTAGGQEGFLPTVSTIDP